MHTFFLNPLIGAGDIKFGMNKKQVRDTLKSSYEAVEECDYFFDSELCITYDEKDEVEYIEFNGPYAENIQVDIFGLDFFELKADDFIQKMTQEKKHTFYEGDSEIPYSYIFPELELSVWRECIPADVEDAMEEAKEDETYLTDKEIFDEDLEASYYFFTIGIGKKGYYEEIYSK